MSIFGNNGQNPFGALGWVVMENRDNLYYVTAAAVVLHYSLQQGPILPMFGLATAICARELVRHVSWMIKGSKPMRQYAGDESSPPDFAKLKSACIVGEFTGMSVACFDIAFAMITRDHNKVPAAIFSCIGSILPYTAALRERENLPHGLKDVVEAYREMWNYTDNDGKGPKQTQRLLGKLGNAFRKLADRISHPAPQSEPIPATVPSRQYLLAPT